MTTDITELAQSLKAAAEKATPGQWERGDGKYGGELLVYCDDALGSAVCEATSEYNAIPKYQRIDNLDFIAMANPANILALVEELEKAQGTITELENYKAGYFAQKEAADRRGGHLTRQALDILKQSQRIAELEEAEQKLCAANVTLDARAELAERQLAELESRTVTVKMPKLKMLEDYLAEVAVEERKAILLGVRMELHRALNAEGIKWEAE